VWADLPSGNTTREERFGNFETQPAAAPGRTPLWRMG